MKCRFRVQRGYFQRVGGFTLTENRTRARNCSIDIFRYICAIMVVAIHTHPFSEINEELSYASLIATRTAVPFFLQLQDIFIFKN